MIMDGDFSKIAKPVNQVPLADYMKYMDQYFRPLTEEDLDLLRDPIDDFSPYAFPTPPSQPNYYLQLWALEDKKMVALCDNFQYPQCYKNPHNFVELDNGDIGQGEVDLGPLTSRILQSLVEARVLNVSPSLLEVSVSDEEGLTASPVLDGNDLEVETKVEDSDDAKSAKKKASLTKKHSRQNSFSGTDGDRKRVFRGRLSSSADRSAQPRFARDMDMFEERIKRELHVVGVLNDKDLNANLPDKDELGHELRSLQSALHKVADKNSQLLQRLLDVATGYKALEEYEQVFDELRDQIKVGYSRKYAKSKKSKLKKLQQSTAAESSHDVSASGPASAPVLEESTADANGKNEPDGRNVFHSGGSGIGYQAYPPVSDELLHKMARYRQIVRDVGRFFTFDRFPFNPKDSIFDPEKKPKSAFSNLQSN